MRELLPGVKVFDLRKILDERGFFAEVFREDWDEFLEGDKAAQVNLSMTHPGVIRAWHRHLRGQVDYFVVIKGAIKICIYDDEDGSPTNGQLNEIIASSEKPQVVRVPGHYWHGFKVIGYEPALLVYFVTKLYNYESPDEERRPWNDLTVVPALINGRVDDPRIGKSWDWNYPPHR